MPGHGSSTMPTCGLESHGRPDALPIFQQGGNTYFYGNFFNIIENLEYCLKGSILSFQRGVQSKCFSYIKPHFLQTNGKDSVGDDLIAR